jgi:hypothetical protein
MTVSISGFKKITQTKGSSKAPVEYIIKPCLKFFKFSVHRPRYTHEFVMRPDFLGTLIRVLGQYILMFRTDQIIFDRSIIVTGNAH